MTSFCPPLISIYIQISSTTYIQNGIYTLAKSKYIFRIAFCKKKQISNFVCLFKLDVEVLEELKVRIDFSLSCKDNFLFIPLSIPYFITFVFSFFICHKFYLICCVAHIIFLGNPRPLMQN